MAGEATDVALCVHRVDGMHVLGATRMTRQAAIADRLGGHILEGEYFGDIAAALHVRLAGTMAAFAALFGRAALLIEGGLPVRSLLPSGIDFIVAGLASLRADVTGGDSLLLLRWLVLLGAFGRSRLCDGEGSGQTGGDQEQETALPGAGFWQETEGGTLGKSNCSPSRARFNSAGCE